jgi:hypothetical protein
MKLICLFYLLSIGIAFSQSDCGKYPKDYIPKNLDDALNYMDCVWTDKEGYKNKSEKDAVGDAHFVEGQWIRNDWELWKGKNSLYQQFKSLGITFPEDISSVILTSFHRQLNHKDIDLNGQVQEYKQYKKRQELITLERNRLAQKLKVGDSVTVVFSRNQSTKDSYTLALLNYESSALDKPTNCFIKGLVKQKKKAKGSSILTIEITNTTNCDSSHLGDKPMNKGQTFSYNMTYFNLKMPAKE